MYYQYKESFEDQTILNNMIDDLATTFNVKRSSLNIVRNKCRLKIFIKFILFIKLASNKGLVAGNLEFVDSNGNHINCKSTNSVLYSNHKYGFNLRLLYV